MKEHVWLDSRDVCELVLAAGILLLVPLRPQPLQLEHAARGVQTQQLLLVDCSDTDVYLKHIFLFIIINFYIFVPWTLLWTTRQT